MLKPGLASLLLLAACVTSTEPGSTGGGGGGGKADGASGPVVSCAGLRVERSAANAWEYVATVTDQAAIDFFLAQAQTTECHTGGGAGTEVCVPRALPWMAKVVERAGQRALELRDLRAPRDGHLWTSGPPGSDVELGGDQATLTIRGATMPGSHEVIYYTVGGRTFGGCGQAITGGDVALDFDAAWNETASGPIHAGDAVVLHYDPARLAGCAATQGGIPQWNIRASYQIDGGEIRSVQVGRNEGGELVAADPMIQLPRGRDLEVWFEATNRYGCHEYDSDFGNNYHFAIE